MHGTKSRREKNQRVYGIDPALVQKAVDEVLDDAPWSGRNLRKERTFAAIAIEEELQKI